MNSERTEKDQQLKTISLLRLLAEELLEKLDFADLSRQDKPLLLRR